MRNSAPASANAGADAPGHAPDGVEEEAVDAAVGVEEEAVGAAVGVEEEAVGAAVGAEEARRRGLKAARAMTDAWRARRR